MQYVQNIFSQCCCSQYRSHVFPSSTYQHPEIVVNIVQVHLPQQTLEFSHQDSSMLPSEHMDKYIKYSHYM